MLCSDKNRENSLSIATKRYFWKDRLIHGCLEIWNFSSRVELDISRIRCPHSCMRCRVEHEKENSISPGNHELFCILYKRLTNKNKSTLFTFHVSQTRCHSFMMLNRASLKHVNFFRNLSRVETRFLSVVIL